MSSIEVNIQPKEFVTVRRSNKIAIFITQVFLFEKAEIHVHFLDENGICIEVEVLTMEGSDYSSWADNDQYVIDWTLGKLGISKV